MYCWVYILRCADSSLYTGQTNDVKRRVADHNAGRHCRYTFPRRPVTLAFKHRCASLGDALRLEYALKQLSRKDKEALVGGERKILRRVKAGLKRRDPLTAKIRKKSGCGKREATRSQPFRLA